jgi:CRP-like cAMP-binding protein
MVGKQSPLERLADLLLQFHARLRAVGRASERSLDMPLSQDMIGDLLGLSAPHVNRMLRKLRADGMISMHRRHIEFLNPEALCRLAEFSTIAPMPRSASG